MKILIIPDIHQKHKHAEKIISHVKADKIIFLGDYFDSHTEDNSGLSTEKTAIWLKESVMKDNRVHLFGNHDLPYFIHQYYTECPGWTPKKHELINIHMKIEHWEKLKFYHFEGDWLFTHAGLTAMHLKPGFNSVQQMLAYDNEKAMEALISTNDHYFYTQRMDVLGPLWIRPPDGYMFVPIQGLNQMFGHTYTNPPWTFNWSGGQNIDLDSWLHYYAILEDGKMTVHKTPEEISPPIVWG
jgi:hypothetical protein